MENNFNMFTDKIKKLREINNMTQLDLSIKLNMTRRSYINLETGRFSPKYDTLIAIANLYDVSIDYLVGRTENKDSHKL